ncbi:ABC transporter G family member 23-like [Oppia nitens]|uniref:ABC transporter G family member 23-like n=1 Tax=Oppia nitens TaxID=1686743 RepID=UPI0023DB0656|nr:ABC transporter G family member 23-like [Oppia nitens]XP_054165932.1 ABC transporter G family member 23-like [Oppia nitens]
MSFKVHKNSSSIDSDSDDGRLASLDALRFALSTAPFFRRIHNIERLDSDSVRDLWTPPDKCAINVNNVCFAYNKQLVLDNVNLQVPKGRIYALLGSTSSGKTTLLKCLIGRLRPQSGHIRVFGTNVCNSRVPGIGVGYMPQGIALHNELTINETLEYYGNLYCVPMALINQRINFLLSLFNLPDEKKLIRNLTDNHRWRISLAVSLIHSPPLLLLDEPTVNVDPLIRLSIWDHLNCLCREEGLTVFITTHYMEEADGAYKIGLMRDGRILAEDKPNALFLRFNTNTFDKLYLKLCQIDNDFKQLQPNFVIEDFESTTLPIADWPLCERRLTAMNSQLINFNFLRFFASIKKNVYVIRGNLFLMLFFFMFPSLQIILFCLSIGNQMRDLPIATYNSDKFDHLSRQFLRFIDNEFIRQYEYSSIDSAINSVVRGHVWTAIEIPDNFSQMIETKYIHFNSSTNLTIQDFSTTHIKLYTDLSNALIGQLLIHSLIKSVRDFLSTISDKYIAKYSSPIVIDQIIYGSENPTFKEFLAPGYVVAIVFVSPMLLTAYLLIKDQMNGLLERCLSTGTSGFEVLLSHFITQLKLLVIQELLVLSVTFVIYKVPMRGPVMPLLVLVYLQGVVGISFGLLISAICPNAISAILLTSGTVIPGVFLSGITWPIEAMPRPLAMLSKALPLTLPIESMRCIISRGTNVFSLKVLIGFIISCGYSLLITLFAIFIFKWRTSS